MANQQDQVVRCAWPGEDPLYIEYHDTEWGVPVHDDNKLFEFLVLEGAQAGLSWITILKRRQAYQKAYEGFDPKLVAKFSEAKTEWLLSEESGIIRNRQKVLSSIKNAKVFLDIQREFGSFSAYQWGWVNSQPVVNKFDQDGQVPAQTELSRTISNDLKRRGMSFVGPTIIYAYLQATGVVNDHIQQCFRFAGMGSSGRG